MQSKCFMFFYDGYVSLAPTIIGLSETLEKHGYQVTIYATQTNTPQPASLGNNIKIVYFSNKIHLPNFLNRPVMGNFIKIYKIIKFAWHCLQDIKTSGAANSTDKIINIGVDAYGAVAALLNYYRYQQKYIFLSLEIEDQKEKFPKFTKFFVSLTNLAYKQAEAVIIQDEERFKTLGEYCKFKQNQVFYLPNSPLASNESSSDLAASNFFRDKFNLSPDIFPYLIIQAGMISDGVCCKNLARAFAEIDNGSALIFHGVVRERNQQNYLKLLQQINSKNLFISLELLPHNQLEKIYTAATIGLAFYEHRDDNFTKIAMASGKIPQYLRHGKPVLVSNLPSLVRLVEKYNFGCVIKDTSDSLEIKSAIEKILSDYKTYSQNAQACFAAEFDFAKKMEPVLEFIDSL